MVQIFDLHDKVLKRPDGDPGVVDRHADDMAALFAVGAEAVEVEGKTFDGDHALEGGVGCVDAAHLPAAPGVICKFQVVGCVIAVREVESLERQVECRGSCDVDCAGLDVDTGKANVFRGHAFLNPWVDGCDIAAFPHPGVSRVTDTHREEGHGRGFANVSQGRGDKGGASGGKLFPEKVEDLHGLCAFGIGPEQARFRDGAAHNGLPVAAEPVGGADANNGPVGGARRNIGGDGVPRDGVEEVALEHALDSVVAQEGGAVWRKAHWANKTDDSGAGKQMSVRHACGLRPSLFHRPGLNQAHFSRPASQPHDLRPRTFTALKTTATPEQSRKAPVVRPVVIMAGMAGNTMEWFDFGLYGVLAPTLGKLFFPEGNQLVSILAVFGVFAAGYLMRMAGGAIFGHIADHQGRRRVLLLSAGLMAVTTALCGMLPVYASIGIAAPILFTILRLLQGLSVGGEFITSLIYLLENAPPHRRALFGSLAGSSATVGLLMGSGFGVALFTVFTNEQVLQWAWRLPFLLSIPLGLAIAVLRTFLPAEEAPERHVGTRERHSSVFHAFSEYPMVILKTAIAGWATQTGFYIVAIFMPSYLVSGHLFPQSTALAFQAACMGLVVILNPLGGYLADKIGRKTMVLVSSAGCAVAAVPLLMMVNTGVHAYALSALLGFSLIVGPGNACYSVWAAERFPRSLRASGLGLSYNIAAGIMGGMTPLICTSLMAATHNRIAPAGLVILASAITILTSLRVKETGDKPLR